MDPDTPGTVVVRTTSGEWDPRSETRAGVFVELSVKDDGCGMDERTLSRALDPFFSTRLTGRGLGLPVVLGLARTQGGAVGIDSTPGEGTEVTVRFPASEEEG